jgi:hypothetical protein
MNKRADLIDYLLSLLANSYRDKMQIPSQVPKLEDSNLGYLDLKVEARRILRDKFLT